LGKQPRPELISKCIELMYFQASNAYASSVTVGLILGVLFWNRAPRAGIIGWFVCYGLMIVVRHRLGGRFLATPRRPEDVQRWLHYFAIVVGICGVIWGVYGVFLARYSDTYDIAVVVLALGALLSGAVTAYSVSMLVYLVFSMPTMLPIGLWLLSSQVPGRRFLGMMAFAWVIFLFFAARRFRKFALESLGHQFENVNLVRNLEELAGQLKRLSAIDSLTNVANRRSFDEEFEAALTSAKREGAPLSLILCDIDFFKHYNDVYGHMQGDVCLRSIACQLDTVAKRLGALAARIGGEEFAVILRQAGVDGGMELAEELRRAIERLAIVHSKSHSGFVTGSFGVCSMVPADATTRSDLLQRADEALYEAKRSGRNRVCADQLSGNNVRGVKGGDMPQGAVYH
jgi:diguanylate cyclase (GGDEF)-like protein